MDQRRRCAFILDKDQFFRLSLNKILKKYGFEVEEIEDLSQIDKRKKEVEEGVVLAEEPGIPVSWLVRAQRIRPRDAGGRSDP